MTKMATIPVYGIKLLKLLQDQKVYNLGLGIYIYMIGDMGSTKFAQMIILGWPWTTLRQGQIWLYMHLDGKIWKYSFFYNR